jgi:hypothetical protein
MFRNINVCRCPAATRPSPAQERRPTASGKVVRHYAEKFILENRVDRKSRLNLSDNQILTGYDKMLEESRYYEGLREQPSVSYG